MFYLTLILERASRSLPTDSQSFLKANQLNFDYYSTALHCAVCMAYFHLHSSEYRRTDRSEARAESTSRRHGLPVGAPRGVGTPASLRRAASRRCSLMLEEPTSRQATDRIRDRTAGSVGSRLCTRRQEVDDSRLRNGSTTAQWPGDAVDRWRSRVAVVP